MSLAGVLAIACGEDDALRKPEMPEETRAIMREIFSGIRVALPASADPGRFRDEANRAEIAAALDAIADRAALLERHARSKDAQMRFLAGSVARDASDVRRAYQEGRYDRAAYLLRSITENCIACHTRLPSSEDSPLSEGFVDSGALEELPPAPRASLQIATRRFDDALDTLEALFASPEHPALMLGPLTDYLVVDIRVKGDYERPLPVLRRFAEREDLWERLRLDVEGWIDALPRLRERASGEPALATAREIIAEGNAINPFPEGHTALAHLVVASSILERFIDGHPSRDRDLAESYYLLGVAEARIGRNTWVTPAPFLLETAIRIAPGERFAQEAYALLERETLRSYEGSEFEELPAEEARRLRELKQLVDAG